MGVPSRAPAALVVLLLAAARPGAAATGPPSPIPTAAPPVFSVGLDEVQVTVSVEDKKGRPITDLRKEDFAVYEDGRRQEIQLFARATGAGDDRQAAREALDLDLGLLLDTSESMLQELKLSQQAAVRFLDSVPRAHELYTIFFDDDIRVSRYDSENQQGLFERIHSAKGGGYTALYDAIAVYLSRVRDGSGRKILVLFTDGEDSRSELSLHDLVKLVRSSRVTIYSIAFQGQAGRTGTRAVRARACLQQLADLTGGAVFAPQSSRDLAGIYQRILDDLAGQYVIGYVPDDLRPHERFRKLKVTANRPGVRVRHRMGYVRRPPDAP